MTTVVKLGGSVLDDASLRASVMRAIATAAVSGHSLVVVHGGGKHIDRQLALAGIPKRTAGGLRITDAATLDVVVRTLKETVNEMIVRELRELGLDAQGTSGHESSLIVAEPHPPVDGVELGFVGRVCAVDPSGLIAHLERGSVPVVACVAAACSGGALNVNADSAAAAVATALGARRIVYLTDVEGLLDAVGNIVEQLSAPQCRQLLLDGSIQGGMRPKLESIVAALESGVAEALIAGPAKHETVLLGGMGGTRLAAA